MLLYLSRYLLCFPFKQIIIILKPNYTRAKLRELFIIVYMLGICGAIDYNILFDKTEICTIVGVHIITPIFLAFLYETFYNLAKNIGVTNRSIIIIQYYVNCNNVCVTVILTLQQLDRFG